MRWKCTIRFVFINQLTNLHLLEQDLVLKVTEIVLLLKRTVLSSLPPIIELDPDMVNQQMLEHFLSILHS